jgi:hypothetical protein
MTITRRVYPVCFGRLAPVIENVDLVCKRYSNGFKVGNGRDDLARSYIPLRIVVEADD